MVMLQSKTCPRAIKVLSTLDVTHVIRWTRLPLAYFSSSSSSSLPPVRYVREEGLGTRLVLEERIFCIV